MWGIFNPCFRSRRYVDINNRGLYCIYFSTDLHLDLKGGGSGKQDKNTQLYGKEAPLERIESRNARGNFDIVQRWQSTAPVAKRQKDEGIMELGVPSKVMT